MQIVAKAKAAQAQTVVWCDNYLIDGWRTEWKRLWSLRVPIIGAVIMAVLEGLQLVWPALAEDLPHGMYVAVGIGICVAMIPARMIDQKKLFPGGSDADHS